MFDVFISYAHGDMPAVEQLEAQLTARGLRVWRDINEIASFEDFTRTIGQNLRHSKVLLAWYSKTYPTRPFCQWELTTALCADPGRVLVINPEDADGHIWPESLRAHKYGRPDDEATLERIVETVRSFSDPLPLAPVPDARRWVGIRHDSGSSHFVGREETLWTLDDTLRKDPVRRTTGLVVLHGLAGMGKSMLAEEYARRFAARWPGGVYRVVASAGSSPADFHRSIITQLAGNGVAGECKTDADAKRVVQGLLPGEPYLWLVDDLPEDISKEQAEGWLAPTGQGHSLITSRNRKLDWLGQGISLEGLSLSASLELLTWRKPLAKDAGGAEQRAATAICSDLLGGHPLSIDVAGALYPEVFPTCEALYSALKTQDAATLALSDELELILPTGHEPGILRTFAIALDRLKGSPELQVLRLASLLAANQPVPRTLLEASLPDFGTAPLGLAIKKLCQRSLCHGDGNGGMILHPVPGIIVRGYYGRDGELDTLPLLAKAARDAFVRLIRETAEQAPLSCLPLLPHGRQLSENAPDEQKIPLLLALGHGLHLTGSWQSARQSGEQALQVCQRVLGPEHPNTLTSMSNLAATLLAQGDHAGAREMQEQVLLALQRVLGPEHPETLTSMGNLAETLRAQGDHAGAREMQEQVLLARQRVLGPEHPHTLTSMNNLATTLWAQGDHAGARELQEQVLPARQRVLGPEHPDTLRSMNNLATTLLAQGDHAGARKLQEQVLQAHQRVQGPEHPETLKSMSNLASTLSAQGDHAGARQLEEQVLQASQRVLGPEHPHTLSSMNNLAETYRAQGEYDRAREMQEQVLQARQQVLGPDHPATLTSMANLGASLLTAGQRDKALPLLVEAWRGKLRVLGKNHPDTRGIQEFLQRHYPGQVPGLSGDAPPGSQSNLTASRGGKPGRSSLAGRLLRWPGWWIALAAAGLILFLRAG